MKKFVQSIGRDIILIGVVLLILVLAVTDTHAQLRVSYYEKGRSALKNKNYVEAVRYLNYDIDQGGFYKSYYLRGVAKYSLSDYHGAENDFTKCIELTPTFQDAFFRRAISRDRQFDFERALNDYNQAQKLDSSDWRVFLNRSVLNLFLQNFERVVEDCNKAIEMKSKGEAAHVIRGMAQTQLHFFDEALADFSIALRRNPMNDFTRIQRGVCYMEMGMNNKALAQFNEVLDRDSTNTRALFQRALLMMNDKKPFSAIQDLDRVIEISPFNTSAIFNRAIAKSQLEDHAGAIDDYNLILETNDENILAYYNRAGAKDKSGDLEGAIEDYSIVIELSPEFADAYYARSMVKKKLNNDKEAALDFDLADSLSQAFTMTDDSINQKNALALMRMTALVGDDHKEEEDDGKIQYKHVDILVKPYFVLAPFQNPETRSVFYDASKKENYGWEWVGLFPATDTVSPDAIQQEIASLDNDTFSYSSGVAYLVRRGILHSLQENYNKAFTDYNMAISLNRNNLLAYFGRANARLSLQELIDNFEVQTTEMAGEAMYVENNGAYLGAAYKDIIDDYHKVIKLDGDFPYAYFNCAYVKCLADQYNEAIKDLSKAIELSPDFPEAYFNRGVTYLYLKNTEQGCADLSKAGELGVSDSYNIMLRYCTK